MPGPVPRLLLWGGLQKAPGGEEMCANNLAVLNLRDMDVVKVVIPERSPKRLLHSIAVVGQSLYVFEAVTPDTETLLTGRIRVLNRHHRVP